MKTALKILIPIIGCLCTWLGCNYYYQQRISKIENASMIVISKQNMELNLINYKGDTLFCTPIAAGKAYGNKRKQGDMRTPEGAFKVVDIQDASKWTHDFHDGKGEIKGAYGPFFIRLAVPGHKGIGIHGTHDSLSIGTRITEGCIRLENRELEKLVSMLNMPMTVVITPSAKDESNN